MNSDTISLDTKTFDNLNHLNLTLFAQALNNQKSESYSPRMSIFKRRTSSKARRKDVPNNIDNFLDNLPKIEFKLLKKETHFLTIFMNFTPLFSLWSALPSSMKFLKEIENN